MPVPVSDERRFHVTLVVRGVVTATSAPEALRQFRADALDAQLADSAIRHAQVSVLAEGEEFCEAASTAWPPSMFNGVVQ